LFFWGLVRVTLKGLGHISRVRPLFYLLCF
jgi:hypothetical protein